jgi:arginase
MTPTARREVVLIGAPTDVGAGERGASMGPEALRVAGLYQALSNRGLKVIDRGNLSGPGNPWLPPVDGYRHLQEVIDWNRRVHEAVHTELTAARLPILLGGDHCLGIGSCGSTRTRTSTPASCPPAETFTACPSPACADSARRN